jgi:hypothetical protein
MPAPLTTYLMAFFAMGFAATSALVLFRSVDHFDAPDVDKPVEQPKAPEHIAA